MNPIFVNIFWFMRFDSCLARHLSKWTLFTRDEMCTPALDERPWILRWGAYETNIIHFSAAATVEDVLNTLVKVVGADRDKYCFKGLEVINRGDLPEYRAIMIDVYTLV